MVVETAIRAAVIPDVLMDGGLLQHKCILKDANERQHVVVDKKTKNHWVLEIARTIAILDACYAALFMP